MTARTPGFLDESNEPTNTATLLGDDQIDFLDHEVNRDAYRDEFTDDDDDDDVFRYADTDEEDAIGLARQTPRK